MAESLPTPLRLGTRGSPLALKQAELAAGALGAAEPALAAPGAIEIVPIRTTGDAITDRPLADIGGKGLFAKEIERALLDGRVDIAVHSLKDMESFLPDGLVIAGVLPREDPRDALIFAGGERLDDLPAGAVIGTCSIRREAQIRALRPDVGVVPLRGNVATRLARLESGDIDATFLAMAGLLRLGKMPEIANPIDPETMLPAAGQGTVALQCRDGDDRIRPLLAAASDGRALAEMRAERALLATLDGSCRTPIGALARQEDGTLTLDALVAAPDGSRLIRERAAGESGDAVRLGEALGMSLKEQADPAWFED